MIDRLSRPPSSRSFSEPRPAWTRREVLEGVAATLAAAAALGTVRSPLHGVQAGPAAAAGSAALPTELWRAGAGQLAEAIAGRRVTSLDVVEAHLARIDSVNAKINAMPVVFADEARAAAREADAAVARGAQLGPLHGVPFTIKDNLDQAGKPNTHGLEENRAAVAQLDHPVVERMRTAGGVPLGRTNLPDLGLRVHSFSEIWGRTLNPWNSARNVGGSSGGEAAALATGMSPIGLGNDIGGSLRNPANCCGIAALKPSLGRIPDAGGGGLAGQLMAVNGPMARSVADVRLGYRILSGVHVRDPWSMPVPLDLPDPAAPLRVALVPEPSGGTTHPAVAEGVRKAGRALAAAGYAVEDVEPPRLAAVFDVWMDFLGTELFQGLDYFRDVMSEEAFLFLDLVMSRWEFGGLERYQEALTERHTLLAEWSEFFTRYPLVVGPVFTQPPFEVGYDVAGVDQAWDVMGQLRLVVAVNLLGIPAVAVPVGVADGLPMGVQVIADRFREDLALDGAAAIEHTLGVITPIDPLG
ncbi:MAG TPA: amidase [Thermoanaerobaculia bacterium]|nr:amidase [Thermoanaerobaculia bacterium]